MYKTLACTRVAFVCERNLNVAYRFSQRIRATVNYFFHLVPLLGFLPELLANNTDKT